MLPDVHWTVDGHAVQISDWSCNNVTNFGFDQFRGVAGAAQARSLPSDVAQGSVVTGYTDYGAVVWQGRLSAPPTMGQDSTVVLAAQGHAFSALKMMQRLALRLAFPSMWQLAHIAPLNYPADSTTEFSIKTGIFSYSGEDADGVHNALAMSNVTSATKVAVAVWVPGMRFKRAAGRHGMGSAGSTEDVIALSTADGPNIAGTIRDERVKGGGGMTEAFDITFVNPGDAVVLAHREQTTTFGFNTAFLGGGDELILSGTFAHDLIIQGDTDATHLWTEEAAKAIGDRLGYDTSSIGAPGVVQLPNFDWPGGAASALSELGATDDLRWRVLESTVDVTADITAKLEYGPYERVWEVSGATGATWQLEPLELYNRVVAQYITPSGGVTQVVIDADPDPLWSSGLVNELHLNLSGRQLVVDVPNQVAHKALKAALEQRYRGRISAARIFEAGTGREATYEVRAGDLVRIIDHSSASDLLLRIADVEFSPAGATIGCEASALPIGALGVIGGPQTTLPVRPQTEGFPDPVGEEEPVAESTPFTGPAAEPIVGGSGPPPPPPRL